LRQIAGEEFSSKDFRTWAGTVLAARALGECHSGDKKAPRKKNILQAIEVVAKKLGNTKAVCRKCYIHPAVIESYTDGSLLELLRRRAKNAKDSAHDLASEAAVLALLNRKLVAGNGRHSGSNLQKQLKRSLRGAKSA
jgi:DNA topoisomerase I